MPSTVVPAQSRWCAGRIPARIRQRALGVVCSPACVAACSHSHIQRTLQPAATHTHLATGRSCFASAAADVAAVVVRLHNPCARAPSDYDNTHISDDPNAARSVARVELARRTTTSLFYVGIDHTCCSFRRAQRTADGAAASQFISPARAGHGTTATTSVYSVKSISVLFTLCKRGDCGESAQASSRRNAVVKIQFSFCSAGEACINRINSRNCSDLNCGCVYAK